MDLNKRTENSQQSGSKANPQLRVRTSLRGGESVEACQTNLAYWQDQYYKWYEQAKYKSV
jgi:hypothetical protein